VGSNIYDGHCEKSVYSNCKASDLHIETAQLPIILPLFIIEKSGGGLILSIPKQIFVS
jgi:hypothetical protein